MEPDLATLQAALRDWEVITSRSDPIRPWGTSNGPRTLASLGAELVARFPAIAEQHWCNERLHQLYRSDDRRQAEARWTSLLVAVEASEDPAVWAWSRTLRTWRREIMGYFEVPITNGFTEGCDSKITLFKWLSYRCVTDVSFGFVWTSNRNRVTMRP